MSSFIYYTQREILTLFLSVAKKRTRSASTASEAQVAAAPAPVEPPPSEKAPSQPPKASAARNKRGARKGQAADAAVPEPEEGM